MSGPLRQQKDKDQELLDAINAVNETNRKLLASADTTIQGGLREERLKHLANVRLLLESGANPGAKNKEGLTALMLAAQGRDLDVVVELFKKANADDISKVDKDGNTVLMLAAETGDFDSFDIVLGYYLKHKVPISTKSNAGKDALMIAAERGYSEIVARLLSVSSIDGLDKPARAAMTVDVNEKDKEGNTALMLAAMGGHDEVVKVLLTRTDALAALQMAATKLKGDAGVIAINTLLSKVSDRDKLKFFRWFADNRDENREIDPKIIKVIGDNSDYSRTFPAQVTQTGSAKRQPNKTAQSPPKWALTKPKKAGPRKEKTKEVSPQSRIRFSI